MNNLPKKTKFIDNSKIDFNGALPGVWKYDNDFNANKTLESVNTRCNKIDFYSNKNLDPTNYNVTLQSKNKKSNTQYNRLAGFNHGPGRGILDINFCNELRYNGATRITSKDWKKKKESTINNRFDFLTRDLQNPNNIVLPFARGGTTTRNVSKNNNNNNNNKINNYNINKIKFKY